MLSTSPSGLKVLSSLALTLVVISSPSSFVDTSSLLCSTDSRLQILHPSHHFSDNCCYNGCYSYCGNYCSVIGSCCNLTSS